MTGKLDRHLLEIQKAAEERVEILAAGLLLKYPAPDKAVDPLAWAAHMNMLVAMAEECVMNDLVYSKILQIMKNMVVDAQENLI